jgi:cellulose synthase/poly-beta-1,6-N-acetylglucosamine synthase-like glycosyltransferase
MNMLGELLNYPFISVIIITKDRRDDLKKAIKSLQEINYPRDRFEVVVVEEADEPVEVKGVKYIFIPRMNKGFGYARNIGIKNAKGEIIVFTDDDCIVEKNWLRELAKPFQDDKVMGVAGGVLVKNCNLIGYAENILGFPGGGIRRIYQSRNKIMPIKYLSTCNCAYRKRVFDEFALFNERTKYSGEDYLFAEKVVTKYKCLYNPAAIVYHKPRGSLKGVFKWFVRRGISEVLMLKEIIGKKEAKHLFMILRNSLIVRLSILVILISLLGLPIVVYPLLFLAYYFFLFLRERFSFKIYGDLKYGVPHSNESEYIKCRGKDIQLLLLVPIVKIVMDLGMEWGRIKGFFLYWGD